MMQLQWKILQPDRQLILEIQRGLQCHPITATVLANRNIGSLPQAAHFLQPSLESLPAPTTLEGIRTAVERIVRALHNQETIMVFGDYDADGVTATAVLVNFLRATGADVFYHLPHRIEEGYGLLPMHIMQLAVPRRAGLIITVDCGSSSFDAAAAAARFGIDVIITDHHNIDALPGAYAVVNPKRADQPVELADLAGVGVAFYLVIALRAALREQGWWQNRPEPNLKAYCDLVAIGTVADMVSLKGVNRVLVRAGLDQINRNPRPGIHALLAACGIRHTPIQAEDISFRMAPRINAAGRVAHANIAFELLNASSLEAARPLAEHLNVLNYRRQETENDIYCHLIKSLDSRLDWLASRKSLVLAGSDWHEGVLGIVAAKLVARYHRPVVVVSAKNEIAKGSGRSIAQVDLHAALTRCGHLLERFGGHRMAAGLSVRTENIGALQCALESAVTELIQDKGIDPLLEIDSEIELGQISTQLMDELEGLSPFGTDNPPPLFMAREVKVNTAAIVGRAHRRMVLCQPNSCTPPIAAIQFNIEPDCPRAESFGRLAFRLQWNRYKGEKEIQMVVEAF